MEVGSAVRGKTEKFVVQHQRSLGQDLVSLGFSLSINGLPYFGVTIRYVPLPKRNSSVWRLFVFGLGWILNY
jgi:hypothetical protein